MLTRLTDKLYAGYQHIFANVPVVFKELHKLLVTSRGFTVIVVLLLVVMYFISYGKMAFSDNSRERDRIYLEKGGADYSQISALIDERRADYMQAVQKVWKLLNSMRMVRLELTSYRRLIRLCLYMRRVMLR